MYAGVTAGAKKGKGMIVVQFTYICDRCRAVNLSVAQAEAGDAYLAKIPADWRKIENDNKEREILCPDCGFEWECRIEAE